MRALLVIVITAALATMAGAQAGPIDFSTMEIGAFPKGFDALLTGPGTPGQWQIAADPEAAGGRALAQVRTDPEDGRFPVLAWRMVVPADVELRSRIKPVSGKVDQAGGLVVRLLDRNTA